ncbi:unnamed protein product [Adineta ricciae]|uniref:BZIP domain-containing protein n=1 Tax=Adineta ricciae TaxID=249248 RepID=A0A815SVU3_ADIRI|nr:unnamed protein product [Adineta ricciae]CAF1493912.1 unnamed protein product [Adineta ricciae]
MNRYQDTHSNVVPLAGFEAATKKRKMHSTAYCRGGSVQAAKRLKYEQVQIRKNLFIEINQLEEQNTYLQKEITELKSRQQSLRSNLLAIISSKENMAGNKTEVL